MVERHILIGSFTELTNHPEPVKTVLKEDNSLTSYL